jgi:5-methylcytosine-specific restriction endonuclease McrA
MKDYHAATGNARRDYMRSRMVENGERVRELDRNRYERDKEKRIALACEHVKIRRARMAGVETDPGVTVPALRKIHGDNCCYCGIEMTFTRGKRGDGIAPHRATLEHVLPITKGGSHTFANTALACHRCNVTKNARTVDEWKEARGHGWKEAVAPGAS